MPPARASARNQAPARPSQRSCSRPRPCERTPGPISCGSNCLRAWHPDRFVRQARERGVVVTGSESFTVGPGTPPAAVRVSLSAPAGRDEVVAGLKILSELLARGPAPEPAIV